MTLPQAETPPAPTCYRHPDRATYISCVRCGRPICPECMRPASVGFQCPEELAEARRTTRRPEGRFGGSVAAGAQATYVLIVVNVAMFLVTTATGTSLLDGSKQSGLFDRLALIPDGRPRGLTVSFQGHLEAGVAHGDYYRLVTSMFLHFGIIHILLNMYVLFVVGPQLEAVLGRVRYVGLYLLAGFGGAVASYLFGPVTEVGAGASGAIFGLFGASFVMARRMQARTGPILATIGINLVLSVSIATIDVRAHLGGLVVGGVAAAVLAYAPRARRTLAQAAGCALVLVLLVLAAGLRTSALRSDDHDVEFLVPGATAAPVSAPVAPVSAPVSAPVTRPVAAPGRRGPPPPA